MGLPFSRRVMVFKHVTRALYRVHNCHTKSTKSERLTGTIQFKHKHITNRTLSPQDKFMHAIANCRAALEGLMNGKADQQLQELKTIVDNAQVHLQQSKLTNKRIQQF
jgi:hypothetical protein